MISRLFKHPARLLLAAGGIALLGLSGPALAHNPMCECTQIEGEQIRCTGGFSVTERPFLRRGNTVF